MGEEAHNDENDEQDGRMVLTPQDYEILLQQLGGNEEGHETETERPFKEEVYEKLEEIARQQHPDPDQALLANLAQ